MLEIFTANANKMYKWCIVLSRLKEEGHKIGNGVQLAHKNLWKKIYTKLKAPEFWPTNSKKSWMNLPDWNGFFGKGPKTVVT